MSINIVDTQQIKDEATFQTSTGAPHNCIPTTSAKPGPPVARPPCSMEGDTHASPTQPLQSAGWLQQVVTMINPGIMQKLYNMVPYMQIFYSNPKPTQNTRQCEVNTPTQSTPQARSLEVIHWQPKHSAASFPDDVCYQPMIQASGNGWSGHRDDHPAVSKQAYSPTHFIHTVQPPSQMMFFFNQ